jgi:hypothetical protein
VLLLSMEDVEKEEKRRSCDHRLMAMTVTGSTKALADA